MNSIPYDTVSTKRKTLASGYVFGAPIGDLGWFASLLMGLATGMMAFFAATFLGIVWIMFYNARGHHADFSLSYRVAFWVGIAVAVMALGYLGIFWAKRLGRKA